MSWTDERINELQKLWKEGLSASQIAARLGGVSRNAVIGKVHRLGLPERASSPGGRPRGSKTKNRSGGSGGYRRRVGVRVVGNTLAYYDADYEPATFEDVVVPLSKKMQLVELTDQTCKWPSGDPTEPDFSFCGHKTKEEKPYCEYHSRVAFLPTSDRRRKKK